MSRLTYRAVWQVDDFGREDVAATVAKRLGSPAVSAAFSVELLKLLVGEPHPRPEIGAVSVVARSNDSAPLDPDGPFATPSGQDLLAGFLTDLLAWNGYREAGQEWHRLPAELVQRARGLLAGLTVEVRPLQPLPKGDAE